MEDHYQGLFTESLLREILIVKNEEEGEITPLSFSTPQWWERSESPQWWREGNSETPAVSTVSPFMGAASSLPSTRVTAREEAKARHGESRSPQAFPGWARPELHLNPLSVQNIPAHGGLRQLSAHSTHSPILTLTAVFILQIGKLRLKMGN